MNSTGWAITYFATPKIKTLKNTLNGVNLTWGKVNKAAKYRVFLITSKGLKKLADTTSTSYTHKAAKSGKKYTYTVCCITSDGKKGVSAYNSKGWSITCFAAPKFKSISYSASGHVLKWGKVNGAVMYCVLIKSGGKWKALAYTTKCTYTYKKAKAGVKYTYSLRCVNKKKKAVSAFDTKGKSFKSLAAPKITYLSKNARGFNIQWNNVKGASYYKIEYRYRDSTGTSSWSAWKKDTIIKRSEYNYYNSTPSLGGKLYQYRIRCVNSKGVAQGSITYSKKKRFSLWPDVTGVSYLICPRASDYISFRWRSSPGAAKYFYYRKIGGKWQKIGSTYCCSFTYYCNPQLTYEFGIRAVDSAGNILSCMECIHTSYSYKGLTYYTWLEE